MKTIYICGGALEPILEPLYPPLMGSAGIFHASLAGVGRMSTSTGMNLRSTGEM